VVNLKYFGRTGADKDLITEEIKEWLNSGNACCHPVHNHSSSHPKT
jgi:hypothetical protein